MDKTRMDAICCDCGEIYPTKRKELGYRTCLACGDSAAKQVKWTVTIPYSKGAYQVVSNREELKATNPKRTGE
jgi:predicted  nucleic acid-binding Zn-ribbon protein